MSTSTQTPSSALTVDAERNLLLIKGAVPGPNNSLVLIRDAAKKKARAASTGGDA